MIPKPTPPAVPQQPQVVFDQQPGTVTSPTNVMQSPMAKWISLALLVVGGGGGYSIVNLSEIRDTANAAHTHVMLLRNDVEQLESKIDEQTREITELKVAIGEMRSELKANGQRNNR